MDSGLYKPGTMVDHFRVVRLVGHGGMGEVYLARDVRLGRKVALKIIHPEQIGKKEAVDRFLFEARATARFNHPHIVTIYAVGEHDGCPYLALEYLEGQTLRQRMGDEPLAVREALRLGLAVGKGLEEAHRHGILHRDLKPENVLIPRDGRLRVLDFGLAKRIGGLGDDPASAVAPRGEGLERPDEGERGERPPLLGCREKALSLLETVADSDEEDGDVEFRSSGGSLQGTPAYMAPEQWSQRQCTPATDVWALGVILFEMLAGRRPFLEENPLMLCLRVCDDEPAPDIERFREIPGRVADLIAGCLQKRAAERPSSDAVVATLEELVRGDSGAPREAVSPFRGLLPFGERHSDLFFGRDSELDALVERLRSEPVLAVVGPSGAGKSSLVKAGIVPRLRDQGRLVVVAFRPGGEPFSVLAGRLIAGSAQRSEQAFPSPRSSGDRIPVVPEPSEGTDSRAQGEISRLSEALMDAPHTLNLQLHRLAERTGSRVLLYVDQLEELYTLVDQEHVRHRFMEALSTAADDPLEPVRVIVSLRDDFLGRLADSTAAREALSRVAVVRSPDPERLVEILTRPLEAVGYRYEEPSLVEQMLNAVRGEPACLPLLQFTCHALWSQRDRSRQTITRQAYESIGGVEGALARHADGVLDGLPPDQLRLARKVLLRLVTAESTRKVLPLSDLLEGLGAATRKVVDHLVAERLLSVRRSRGLDGGVAELELVHESLISSWSRLARWLEASREDRAFLEQLQQAADLWEKRGRRTEEVWDGAALEESRHALARGDAEIPARVRAFLRASELEATRLRRRSRALKVGGVLSLALIAAVSVVVSLVIYRQSGEVRRQRDQAQRAHHRAEQKRAESERESARASWLRQDILEARAKLRSSLERMDHPLARALWDRLSREPLQWKVEIGSYLNQALFAPNGRYVAVASADRSVYLVDSTTGAVTVLRGQTSRVYGLAFAPDGERLAVATAGGRIWLWDPIHARLIRSFQAHVGSIWGVSYSPGGRYLASGGKDRVVRVFDAHTGRLLRALRGHRGVITRLTFGSRGRLLASASHDGTVRLWDVATGGTVRVLDERGVWVSDVALSPDGSAVALARKDGEIAIRSVTTGEVLRRLFGHSGRINAVAFSHDGRLLASGAVDGTVRLWDVRSGRLRGTLRGHRASVWSVDFSPDDRWLVSAGTDKTVRLWSVSVGMVAPASGGHSAAAVAVDFSPTGELIATGSYDDTVRIWEVASGRVRLVLRGHRADVTGVAFSPDGRRVASVSKDRTVRLWDVSTGAVLRRFDIPSTSGHLLLFCPDGTCLALTANEQDVLLLDVASGRILRTLKGHRTAVWGLAFSRDGRLLASGAFSGQVRVWDTSTWRLRRTLVGHSGNVWGMAFGADGRQLYTGSWDRTVRTWDLATGKAHVLKLPARVDRLDLSPDGRWLALPLRTGRTLLWDTGSGRRVWLAGHEREVNGASFGPRGKLLATVSDDGSLRLWRVPSGGAVWRAPALLAHPVRLLTQDGWSWPGSDTTASAEETRWMRLARERARLVAESPNGRFGCIVTNDSKLERWELMPLRRAFRLPAAGASSLLALPGGCVLLVGEQARFFDPVGGLRVLGEGVKSMSWAKDELLLVSTGSLLLLDGHGRLSGRRKVSPGAFAVARVRSGYALLFSDGSAEVLHSARSSSRAHSVRLEQAQSGRVTSALEGPAGSLVAGFASGAVGIWSLPGGRLMRLEHLHGPVTHLLLAGRKLFVATDLGDHMTLDLGLYFEPYCEVLRRLWERVPVTWENGIVVRASLPAGHRCSQPPARAVGTKGEP